MTDKRNFSKICVCEYDGSNYCGWQIQRNGRTVQEEIQKALGRLYGEDVKILGAGRTDAGVHALGQVFHYYSENYRADHAVAMALNNFLPSDISIISAMDAPVGFHPIAHAKSKTYCYKIINREYRTGLFHNKAWHCRGNIDIEKLCKILTPLKGSHDFTSFCLKKSLKENNVRTVNSIDVDKYGDNIEIRINASGFLHNMMRIIVGTSITMTLNGGKPDDIIRILNAKKRTAAEKTAPAWGLYLEKVFY